MEEGESPKKRKKSFGGARLFLVFLVVGFLLGAFIEHQYLEPILNGSAKNLAACETTSKLLDQEAKNCYKKLSDLNAQLP